MMNRQLINILSRYPRDMNVQVHCVGDVANTSRELWKTVRCFYNFDGNLAAFDSSDPEKGAGCITLEAGFSE